MVNFIFSAIIKIAFEYLFIKALPAALQAEPLSGSIILSTLAPP